MPSDRPKLPAAPRAEQEIRALVAAGRNARLSIRNQHYELSGSGFDVAVAHIVLDNRHAMFRALLPVEPEDRFDVQLLLLIEVLVEEWFPETPADLCPCRDI